MDLTTLLIALGLLNGQVPPTVPTSPDAPIVHPDGGGVPITPPSSDQ